MAATCAICGSVVLIQPRIERLHLRRRSTNIVRAIDESGDAAVPQRKRTGKPKKEPGSVPRKKILGGMKKKQLESDSDGIDDASASESVKSGKDVKGEFSATRNLFTNASNHMTDEERDLRFLFLESLMGHARSGNIAGVEDVMSEMNAVGLKPGPRAHHGVITTYARANDVEGALNAFRLEAVTGEVPLQETFLALGRLVGRAGLREHGEKLLGSMSNCELDSRYVWNVTVDELFKAGHLNDANTLFIKGLDAGFRACDEVYDVLVEQNCKTGNHAMAIDILRRMEHQGRLAVTFHYNCLLLAQGNAEFPEIAAETFDEMRYERPGIKPNTESYNLIIKAFTRNQHGERINDVIDYLGMMLDDYPRVKPNAQTYTLLIECYVKHNVMEEAMRHFRALTRFYPGSLWMLHCDGNHGDPLSLLVRSLCLEGRIVQLVEVLDLMIQEGMKITTRAMFMNRKGRTLVSSWVEPMQAEADIGCEVDFIARYAAEGGLTGERKRWIPANRKRAKDYLRDYEGFRFFPPAEKSYKQYCSDMRRKYKRKLITLLEYEGVPAIGENATREEYDAILERLKRETFRKKFHEERKPKAASKLSVSEMKEELEAQGLPTDGGRSILYQRIQKARRINLAKGQPLWMPPEEEKIEELDEEFETTLSKIDLTNPRQKYRQKCFVEGANLDNLLKDNPKNAIEESKEESTEETDLEADDDVVVDEIVDEDDEFLAPIDGGDEFMNAPRKKAPEDDTDDDVDVAPAPVNPVIESPYGDEGTYVKSTLAEKRREMLEDFQFDFKELDNIEDLWGWTWERPLQAQAPELWSRKHEVELGIQVLQKVVELGGKPTIGDCAMHVQNAIKMPWPTAVVTLVRESHKIGHKFGSKLYEDAVACCLSLEEKDAAVAILTDMEDVGITSSDLIGRVLPERNNS